MGADEQDEVAVDVDRWTPPGRRRARRPSGARGELTLTFVDRDEIAELNAEHLGKEGPTDVLSFPIDDEDDGPAAPPQGIPVLLGDVVVCPAVAADQAADHAGTLDDELALLVVHGVLHVLGHDHAEPDETAAMRARERDLLRAAPLGRPGTGRLPSGAGRLMGGQRRSSILVAIIVLVLLLGDPGHRRDRRSTASPGSRPRRSPTPRSRSRAAPLLRPRRAPGAVHQPAARHRHRPADRCRRHADDHPGRRPARRGLGRRRRRRSSTSS